MLVGLPSDFPYHEQVVEGAVINHLNRRKDVSWAAKTLY